MRKFVLIILLLIAALAAFWVFAGREISVVADQFKMRETESTPVHSVSYEGSGEGGTLTFDAKRFTLGSLNPHVGSNKENQLAIAYGGKVFPFGALGSGESLATNASADDMVRLSQKQSYIPWLTFDGGKPRLNYRSYRELLWKKLTGAQLKMVWSLDPADSNSLNLIRVEISDASR